MSASTSASTAPRRKRRFTPAYPSVFDVGTALLNQGRREEALAIFDKTVQLKPDNADLWRNLGRLCTC
ncbi:MAG: tetratricopeptide repeat protein [Bradyrhizobium sp.]